MDKHAPQKEKWIRGNAKPHVNKNLHSTIMIMSKPKSRTNETKSHDDIINYKKQSSLVFKLNKNQNLNISTNMIQINKVILDLKNSKAAGSKMLVKILKNCVSTFNILKNCINQSVETSNFLDWKTISKTTNITPVFKKDDSLDKLNYRPVSILPLLNLNLLKKILNSILCCFPKAHSTQHALFKLLQLWQKEIHNHGFIGCYNLNGFVEGLYRISQELLISKLDSYGVTKIV